MACVRFGLKPLTEFVKAVLLPRPYFLDQVDWAMQRTFERCFLGVNNGLQSLT